MNFLFIMGTARAAGSVQKTVWMAMVQESHSEGEDPVADEQELDERELNAILNRMIRGKAPGDVLGRTGQAGDLTRRLVERVLDGEITAHMGYEDHAEAGRGGR